MPRNVPIFFEKDEKEIELFSVDVEDVRCLAELSKMKAKYDRITKNDAMFKEIVDFLNEYSDEEISCDFNTASIEISKIERKKHMNIKDFLTISIDSLRDLQTNQKKKVHLKELKA